MPGIFGHLTIVENTGLVNLMASLLTHGEDWFEGKYFQHQFGFHGIVDFKSRLKHDYASLNDKSAVVYGDIYSFRDQKLGKNKAETIVSLYEKHKLDFLKFYALRKDNKIFR